MAKAKRRTSVRSAEHTVSNGPDSVPTAWHGTRSHRPESQHPGLLARPRQRRQPLTRCRTTLRNAMKQDSPNLTGSSAADWCPEPSFCSAVIPVLASQHCCSKCRLALLRALRFFTRQARSRYGKSGSVGNVLAWRHPISGYWPTRRSRMYSSRRPPARERVDHRFRPDNVEF